MKKTNYWIGSVFLIAMAFLQSCTTPNATQQSQDALARVGDKYLPKESLEVFGQNLQGSKDSIVVVNRFIEKWATKELLSNVAEFNLSPVEQEQIHILVDNYAKDLKIKAYLENMVQSKIDTLVVESDLERYYKEFEKTLTVEDMLVQLAYVNVLKDNANYASIKKKFNSSKTNEFASLSEQTLQMKSYGLNDSVWVDVNYLYQKLPFLNPQNKSGYLKNNTIFEVDDQNSTYFVKVKEVKNKGEQIPYDYIKNSLRLLVLNQRKVSLLKQIQEDILNDAKNNKKYEVF
ncbi:hypothetical protein ACYSNM_09705 [Myroides sp. LJL116]